ncbi:MAG: Ribosomal RNA small subunit methyltransferase A [Parcubacteria group bacterium GW2011_GWA2_47_7]|nr:MAG: Ribosomal RNA small subunit methyltransferase A [Parcubacteria group bacterium GW2011_GWA2_47_7]
MSPVHAKKSLGQNFLRSKEVVAHIVDVSDIFPGDLVVEVGPGEGALTNALLNADELQADGKGNSGNRRQNYGNRH